MHPLQPTLGGQLTQVAPHRVFRDTPFVAERLGHDLAVMPKPLEDELLALGGEHGRVFA